MKPRSSINRNSRGTPRHRVRRDRQRAEPLQPVSAIGADAGAQLTSNSIEARATTSNSKALAKLAAKQAKTTEAKNKRRKATKPTMATLKAEQTVRLANGHRLEVGGVRDDLQTRFIWVRDGSTVVLTELGDWHGGSSDGLAKLKKGGILFVLGSADIRSAVAQIKCFRRVPILTRPGWSKDGFGLIDGTVIVPKGNIIPWTAYDKVQGLLGHAGTLDGWKEQVAAPFADQLLGCFFFMTMFAPALLELSGRSDNFGFELAGDPACGKSTLQRLIASAAGPVIGSGDCRYWQTLNSTMNALETRLLEFNGMPLVLDEAGLIPGAGKAEVRAAETRDLAFRMANGTVKARLGEKPGPRAQVVYVISTNHPTTLLVGDRYASESGAIADRLMTISASADRPNGILDYLPASFPSASSFIESREKAAGENYGHAIPAYLQFLVTQRKKNPDRLLQALRKDMARFLENSNTNANDGSQLRVAKAMALVYSAGRFAQRAGVLPRAMKCEEAALMALTLHRAHGRPIVSFDDRLRSVLKDPNTVDQGPAEEVTSSNRERSGISAYIYTGKSGNRELVIPVEQIERVFPDWKGIKDDHDVQGRLLKSADRNTRERRIGPRRQKHACYVFQVMDLIA